MDINLLRELCLGDVWETVDIVEKITGGKYDNTLGYFYQDNGSSILAVAHMDTVMEANLKWAKFYKNTKSLKLNFKLKKDNVTCINLDDRLGVFVILSMLKERGIVPDYLFTIDEESCASTAENFTTKKKYNWVFEFDRKGEQVVLYHYEDEATKELLISSGYKIEQGTFSDISLLELDVKCFNFGVGFHFEHTEKCTASLKTVRKIVDRFERFYIEYKDINLPHDSTKKDYYYSGYGEDYYYANSDYINDRGWAIKNDLSKGKVFCKCCGLTTLKLEFYEGVCFSCADFFQWDEFKIREFIKGMEYLKEDEIIVCIHCGKPIIDVEDEDLLEKEICLSCFNQFYTDYNEK